MLVTCRACGKRISDRAPNCPFCKTPAAAPPAASVLAPSPFDVTGVPSVPPATTAAPGPIVVELPARPDPPPAEATSPRLLPYKVGDFVGESLQIQALLGEGGFGVVYRALSFTTKTTYALKTIRDELLRDDAARAMFRKEAQIWIDLERHPHLVQLHFIEEVAGRLFLAMEYVAPDGDGLMSLEGHLKRRPPDLARSLRWAIELCHGMEYAYGRGVRCHRDIKPANILIASDGKVKVSDFGIAGLALAPGEASVTPITSGPGELADLERTVAGSAFGTPTHMPPEQFSDAASCDERSDIYSFGVVLFQLATGGRLPFYPPPIPRAPDTGARLWRAMRKLHSEASPPAVDSPLAPIFGRCLAKGRDKRYADFGELRADLERLLLDRTGGVAQAPETEQLKGWELANKGNSLGSLGRWDEALACFDEALRLGDGRAAAIHNNRGNALRHLGRRDEALEAFERAIALETGFADPWVNKGLAYTESERWEDAVRSFKRALELDPVSTGAWVSLGYVAGQLGRHDEELQCYDKALEFDPHLADAWFNKGNSLQRLGRHAEALPCLDQCLACAPGYQKAWVTKGIVLSESGRAQEALPCFDEALKLTPEDAQAWYNRGNACAQLGRFAEARDAFAKAVHLAPDFALGWNNKGLAELRLGQTAAGVASLKEFLARGGWQNPEDDGKVSALIRQVESEQAAIAPGAAAAPIFKAVPQEQPVDAPVASAPLIPERPVKEPARGKPKARPVSPRVRIKELNDQGSVLFQRKQWNDALVCFEEALAIHSRNVTALNNKANALFQLGRRDEALAIHERIVELEPLFSGSWVNKGAMEKIMGREAQALRTLQDFLAVAGPEDAAAIDSARREARPLEQKAVRPAPRSHLGWLALGFRAAVKRQWDQALQHFDSACAAAPERGTAWLLKGDVLRENGRINDALTCYEAASVRAPNDARPFHSKGLALAQLRRFEEAEACHARAAELDPTDPAHWSDRGKMLGVLQRYDESIASLARACELAPDAPAPWLNKALAEDEQGREADALDSYEAFLEVAGSETSRNLAPQINQSRRRVAALRAKLGLPSVATPATPAAAPAQSAPQLAPERAHADTAEEAVKQLLGGHDPLDAFAPEVVAELRAAFERGDQAAFARILDHAVAGDAGTPTREIEATLRVADVGTVVAPQARPTPAPNPPAGPGPSGAIPQAEVPAVVPSAPLQDCLKRAEICLNQGQPQRALEWANQAIASDPKNYNTWTSKAEALLTLRRYHEGVAQLDRALALNPRFTLGWQKRATALAALGLHNDALASWETALGQAPRNAQLLNGRGLSLMALQRVEEALTAFDSAIAIDPRLALARFSKAVAEDALGRGAVAAQSFQIFLSLAPPTLAPQIQHARARLAELR
jgi:tetratricopeptide (TPR) repeat protein